MARKRTRKEPDSIADLFGDVVQDRPSFLYSLEEGEDGAPMSLNRETAPPPSPANANPSPPDPAASPAKASPVKASPAARLSSLFGRDARAGAGPREEPGLSSPSPSPSSSASARTPAPRPAAAPGPSPAVVAAQLARAEEADLLAQLRDGDAFSHAAVQHAERLRRARAARAAAEAGLAALPRDALPEYTDDRGLLSAVTVTHGAISVLTLGLYRFWMKTQTRRLLWAHTEIDGERLEYTGRGSELFIGFAIAMAFLARVITGVGFGGAFVGLAVMGGAAGGLVGWAASAAVSLLLISPLIQLAAFRARRYRLARTRWKNIRFGMEGSGWSIAALWLAWAPLIAATGGLIWPLWRWAREARISRAMRWGDAAFEFHGGPWHLLVNWLPFWLMGAAVAAVVASTELRVALGLDDPAMLLIAYGPLAIVAVTLLFTLGLLLAWLNYRASETRLFMNARSLGGARISCTFSMWHIVDAYLAVSRRNLWPGLAVYVMIFAVTSIPIVAAARVEMENPGALSLLEQADLSGLEGLRVDHLFSLDLSAFPALQRPALDALADSMFEGLHTWRAQGLMMMAMAIDYFLSATFMLWLWTYVYATRRHEHLCDSITVHDVNRLEAVRQRAADRGVAGEGMDDAFDFGLL
ncbi:MAG: DUF898 family protein [Pseudomonadota bacterium]|nr:DUF898 family protein [Pseudomonadota bacterium]